MQTTDAKTESPSGVEMMALDWESLGRLVRVRTLQAVALEFAARARASESAPDSAADVTERISE